MRSHAGSPDMLAPRQRAMPRLRRAMRRFPCAALAIAACAIPACSGGSDHAPAPGGTAARRSATADDLARMDALSTQLAGAFDAQATLEARMSRGESLDAADSGKLVSACASGLDTCMQISALLREHGTWQGRMRASLERIAKPAIVRRAKAEEMLGAARKAGKAGSMQGSPARPTGEQAFSQLEVMGMMPYSKAEIDAIAAP